MKCAFITLTTYGTNEHLTVNADMIKFMYDKDGYTSIDFDGHIWTVKETVKEILQLLLGINKE